MNELRSPAIDIQPEISAFVARFQSMTSGVLDGIDWRSVFVAGGIVLGAFMSTNGQEAAKFKDSDIDLYVYGLDPVQANQKIRQIYTTWVSNLKGADFIVYHNLRTIM